MLNKFKTDEVDLTSYKEQPSILVAILSAIGVRRSLNPVDVVIIVDSCFESSKVRQVLGRVRRGKVT